MRADDLSLHDFGTLFRRLMLAYQKPIPAGDLEATIGVYFDTLRGFPQPVVEQAVSSLIVKPEGRYFPRAGDLAQACRPVAAARDRHQGYRQGSPEASDLCPGCRTPFSYAGYQLGNGTVVGRRRCRCRQAGSGWDTEAAKAWVDPGAMSRAEPRRQLRAVLSQPEPARHREAPVPLAAVLTPPADAGDAWEAERIHETKAAFRVAAQQGKDTL